MINAYLAAHEATPEERLEIKAVLSAKVQKVQGGGGGPKPQEKEKEPPPQQQQQRQNDQKRRQEVFIHLYIIEI
jgi:hypothetical protein